MYKIPKQYEEPQDVFKQNAYILPKDCIYDYVLDICEKRSNYHLI